MSPAKGTKHFRPSSGRRRSLVHYSETSGFNPLRSRIEEKKKSKMTYIDKILDDKMTYIKITI